MPALAAHPFERGNRAIAIAVALSLALHAALLFILPALQEAQQRRSEASEPILARLTPPAKPAVSAAPPQAIPDAREAVAAPRTPKRQRQLSPAPALVTPAQPVSIEPEQAAPEAPPTTHTTPVQPAAQTTVRSARPDTPPAPAAIPEVADAGTLAQYRLAIISAAKRYKRYPRVALDNNWQGKVEIRMTISTSGSIAALSVRASAGHAILDQQALEMIERAKDLALIPPALRGREFSVDVPVIFSLMEPGA